MNEEDDVLEQKRQELTELRRVEQLEARKVELEKPPIESSFFGQVDKMVGSAIGVGEGMLSMATGAAVTPIAGVAGIVAEVAPGGRTGAEMIKDYQQAGTYQPRTRQGQSIMQEVAEGGAFIEKGVDWIAETASDNPLVQTAIKTGILGIPEGAGLKAGIARRMDVNKRTAQIESVADELGVDFRSKNLHEQVTQAGAGEAVKYKGQGMISLKNQLRDQKNIVREEKDKLYVEAGNTNAKLRPFSLEELRFDVMENLTGHNKYLIDDMPKVQKLLPFFDDLAERSDAGSNIGISEVFELRKRINQNRPASTKVSENSALNVMVKSVDNFIEDMRTKDLIKGDPAGVQKWKDAMSAHKNYKMKFDDNKIIKKIINDELTPEQTKNLIFGATKVDPGAATVVKGIKNILGEDHPQIAMLRQEMLLPIVKPLLEAKPNFKAFSKNVNDLMTNNRSLVKELAPESLKPIFDLKNITDAALKSGAAPGFELDLAEAMSRILFGHQIAKAALKVKTATLGIKYLQGIGESERKALMAEMLGINPKQPFISKKSLFAGSFLADQVQGGIEAADKYQDPEIPSIPRH